jgi:hypothetical protein
MKTIKTSLIPAALKAHFPSLQKTSLLLAMAFGLPAATSADDHAKVFATPDDAVAALRQAATAADTNALRVILGTSDLQNPDRVQATNDFHTFLTAFMETNRLDHISATNVVLEVGKDLWPFPVPIVKQKGGWSFDAEAGREEIISRRIGRNELDVLATMRAYVDAQREYASRDHNGNEVLQYAQRITSSPGKTDGLYWPIEVNGEMSPLGPMVAEAQGEGYFGSKSKSEANAGPQPYHGYYFKILTRQGKHAPGGKYNYVINGNMIGGFAMVAWPAEYGESGVMTFIVNQQGRVYQKNLGESTARIARKMDAYDPDPTWTVSRD